MRKRIAALLLIVLLAIGFGGIAAYAERGAGPPQYLNPAESNTFRLPIRYKINQASSVNPETMLCFEDEYFDKLYYTDPNDDEPQYEPEVTFPVITVSDLTFGAGTASTEGTVGYAEITIPPVSRVGVYEYMYAIVPDHQALYMDHPAFTLRLIVFNDTEPNSKKMAVQVLVDEPGVDPVTGDPVLEKTKVDEIEVEYKAYEYSISKQVAGNLGDRDRDYEFTVKLQGDWYDSKHISQTYHPYGYPPVTISYSGGRSVEGSFNLEDEIVTTQQKYYEGTELEYTLYKHSFEKEITFSLRHGETVTFKNLPETVVITTTEDDYSTEGYETTIDGTLGRTKTYTIYAPEQAMDYSDPHNPVPVTDPETGDPVYLYGNDSVTVVNTKDKTPDTGIFDLGDLPYLIVITVIAAVIVCGIVFAVVSIRRGSDDEED